jgi:hypothetical protein
MRQKIYFYGFVKAINVVETKQNKTKKDGRLDFSLKGHH